MTDATYQSPVTGMTLDSGSWLWRLTEEEWENYRRERDDKEQGYKQREIREQKA